jgi:hypothetical protein
MLKRLSEHFGIQGSNQIDSRRKLKRPRYDIRPKINGWNGFHNHAMHNLNFAASGSSDVDVGVLTNAITHGRELGTTIDIDRILLKLNHGQQLNAQEFDFFVKNKACFLRDDKKIYTFDPQCALLDDNGNAIGPNRPVDPNKPVNPVDPDPVIPDPLRPDNVDPPVLVKIAAFAANMNVSAKSKTDFEKKDIIGAADQMVVWISQAGTLHRMMVYMHLDRIGGKWIPTIFTELTTLFGLAAILTKMYPVMIYFSKLVVLEGNVRSALVSRPQRLAQICANMKNYLKIRVGFQNLMHEWLLSKSGMDMGLLDWLHDLHTRLELDSDAPCIVSDEPDVEPGTALERIVRTAILIDKSSNSNDVRKRETPSLLIDFKEYVQADDGTNKDLRDALIPAELSENIHLFITRLFDWVSVLVNLTMTVSVFDQLVRKSLSVTVAAKVGKPVLESICIYLKSYYLVDGSWPIASTYFDLTAKAKFKENTVSYVKKMYAKVESTKGLSCDDGSPDEPDKPTKPDKPDKPGNNVPTNTPGGGGDDVWKWLVGIIGGASVSSGALLLLHRRMVSVLQRRYPNPNSSVELPPIEAEPDGGYAPLAGEDGDSEGDTVSPNLGRYYNRAKWEQSALKEKMLVVHMAQFEFPKAEVTEPSLMEKVTDGAKVAAGTAGAGAVSSQALAAILVRVAKFPGLTPAGRTFIQEGLEGGEMTLGEVELWLSETGPVGIAIAAGIFIVTTIAAIDAMDTEVTTNGLPIWHLITDKKAKIFARQLYAYAQRHDSRAFLSYSADNAWTQAMQLAYELRDTPSFNVAIRAAYPYTELQKVRITQEGDVIAVDPKAIAPPTKKPTTGMGIPAGLIDPTDARAYAELAMRDWREKVRVKIGSKKKSAYGPTLFDALTKDINNLKRKRKKGQRRKNWRNGLWRTKADALFARLSDDEITVEDFFAQLKQIIADWFAAHIRTNEAINLGDFAIIDDGSSSSSSSSSSSAPGVKD